MLTKEKCTFALAGLYSAANGQHDEENKNILQQLINEYFDNQPLSLEWFKDEANFNTWIWDNKFKIWVHFIKYSEHCYMQIRCLIYSKYDLYIKKDNLCYTVKRKAKLPGFEFEEGRFFLKEMKN